MREREGDTNRLWLAKHSRFFFTTETHRGTEGSNFYPLDVEKLEVALCLGEGGRELITNNLMWKRCRINGSLREGSKTNNPYQPDDERVGVLQIS